MMQSDVCCLCIQYLVLVAHDIIRCFSGPLYTSWCMGIMILKMTTLDQILFRLNVSTVSRYIFIFHMKNPLAFQDSFWKKLLSVWILLFSYTIQITAWMIPGRRNLGYYTCAGLDPSVDRIDGAHAITTNFKIIFTIIIYLTLGIRICRYKLKFSNEKLLKMGIWDLAPLILSGIIFALNILLIRLAFRYNPDDNSMFLLEYVFRFLWPNICIGLLNLINVCGNPSLKKYFKSCLGLNKDEKHIEVIH